MHAVHVLLFLGAFFLSVFTAVFVVGSLIGLVRTGREVLEAIGRTREAAAEAGPSRPPVQFGRPPAAAPAETRVEVGAVYVGA